MLEPADLAKAMAPIIADHVAKQVAALEGRIRELEEAKPRDGKDGADGAPGADGRDGTDGRDGLDGAAGADGQPGRDGSDGNDGAPGRDGRDGQAGTPGRDGKDGRDGADGLAGADGKDGRDGVDGLGFDDLTVDHDGERGFVLRFQRDDQLKEFSFTLPIVLDRGVFKDGRSYERGDGITWAGSYWIAQRDTTSKPDGSGDWRLAVKKGRDAKAA